MLKTLKRVTFYIDLFNQKIGQCISWLILLMSITMFIIVILRYFFNQGWIWMQESVTYIHSAYFMLSIGYTLLHNKHVRIDIFYRSLSSSKQAILNILGFFFLLLPTSILILYYSFPYVIDSWILLEDSSESGGLHAIFLLKTLIICFPILLLLQGISQTLKYILIFKGHSTYLIQS